MVYRYIVLGVMGLAVIALLLLGVDLLRPHPKPVAAAQPTARVLVAAAALPAGTLIQPGEIGAQPLVKNTLPKDAILDTPQGRASLIGAMVRHTIAPGAPINVSNVIRPGDHGFLAAVLKPGMRAITIGVDAISDSAGLIWPGDHVDVILTQSLNAPQLPAGHQLAAEIVLSDVQVIATGQRIVQGGVQTAPGQQNVQATTVTLEVSSIQAEHLAIAEKLGPLSLLVHSAEPGKKLTGSQSVEPIWANAVSPALNDTNPNQNRVTTMKVFEGSSNGQDFKF
jgi:pilus assembly protein CpaB